MTSHGRALAMILAVALLACGTGTVAAGEATPPPPPPASGCNFAAHGGVGGKQFLRMTAQARYAAIVLCNEGILSGTAPDLFSPDLPVTRGQAVRFVVRALGVPLAGSQTPAFPDVGPQSPYYLYVETAERLGLLPFVQPGADFMPSQPIARDAFAALVVDALADQAAAAALANTATRFTDDAAIPAAYRGDVNEALALGIVGPYTATRYNPGGALLRSGMALALLRLLYQLHLAAPAQVRVAAASSDVAVGDADLLTPAYTLPSGTAVSAGDLAARFETAWTVSPASGAQLATNGDGGATFVASAPGSYTVTETVSGGGLSQAVSGSVTLSVYGPAAQLALSVPQTIVGDGAATATATVTAEDANGTPVGDFGGDITLTDSGGGAVAFNPPSGATTAPQTEAAADGVATFPVVADLSSGRTDTLTATATGLTAATAQISTTAPVATSLRVAPASTTVSVDSVSPDAVTAEVLDQAGNPMPAGAYPVTFSVGGVGTFAGGGIAAQTAVYVGEGTAPPQVAAVTVDSQQGVAGAITVTAAAQGLPAASTTIEAVLTGAPHALAASVTAGTAGAPVGAGAASVTVTAVDANGVPVDLAAPDPVTVTFTATNPDPAAVGEESLTGTIPAGASSVVISATPADTRAGTFAFSVTDQDGLAPAAGSLTLDAGAAAQVALLPATPGLAGAYINASAAPLPFTAQVEDAHGNPVAQGGVVVTFQLDVTGNAGANNQGTATLTAASSATTTPTLGDTVAVSATTDATGGASATFQAQDVPGDTYALSASAAGLAGSPATAVAVEYASAARVVLTTATPSIAADADVAATVDLSLTSAQGVAVPAGDALSATASGGDLVSATSGGTVYPAVGNGVTFPWNPDASLKFMGGAAGPVTLSVTDQSSDPVVTGTLAVNVMPGSPYQVLAGGALYRNGVFTAAGPGVFGPFDLSVCDAGGNAVPDSAPITLSAAQVEAIVGAAGGVDGIRTSASGPDLSAVTLPAGTAVQPIWLEVDGAGGITLTVPTTPVGLLSQLDPIASYTVSPGPVPGQLGGSTVSVLFTTPILPSSLLVAGITQDGQSVATYAEESTLSGGSMTLNHFGSDNGSYGATENAHVTVTLSGDGQILTLVDGADTTSVAVEPTAFNVSGATSLADLDGHPLAAVSVPVTGQF